MATSANPTVNGVEYDHSSHRIRIAGQVETRVKDLNYGATREGAKHIYGTSHQPVGRTRGQYKPKNVSLTLYFQAWKDLRARLGTGFMEVQFDIQFERIAGPGDFNKDLVKACQIQDIEESSSEGGEPTEVKLTMDCMYVIEGGYAPMNNFKR